MVELLDPLFPLLWNGFIISSRDVWEINEIKHVKCLRHSMCEINSLTIINILATPLLPVYQDGRSKGALLVGPGLVRTHCLEEHSWSALRRESDGFWWRRLLAAMCRAQRSCVCVIQLPISNSSWLYPAGLLRGKSCEYSVYEMQGPHRSEKLLWYKQTGAGGTARASGWGLVRFWRQTWRLLHWL